MSDVHNLNKAQAAAARHWWQKLNGFGRPGLADTGGRARLRRSTPASVLGEEATIDLMRRLRKARAEAGLAIDDGRDCVLAIRLALSLCHVRKDTEVRFGRVIGRTDFSSPVSARFKPLRFRRLLEAETEEEIASGLRRALEMIGGEVNVADLALHLITWASDGQKRRLILDYYDTRDPSAAGS